MSTDHNLKGKMVFVMGGGKFGTNALTYLKAKGAKVLIADKNPNCKAHSKVDILADSIDVCDVLEDGQTALVVADAIKLLTTLLETKVPDMVVTAIPGNAMAKVVDCWLARHGMKMEPYLEAVSEVLENLPKSLVSFVDEDSAVLVVSYMPPDMRCNDNCMPPKTVCASTGRPKLASMDKLLKFSIYNVTDQSAVLTSKQLTGGLGAINGKDLQAFLQQLDAVRKPCTLAIGTACHCHGVLNLVKITN